MEKLYLILEILKVVKSLFWDSDQDGVNDLFDSAPHDPEKQ